MKQRYINDPMVLETLRRGRMPIEPELAEKGTGLICRMTRYVAGTQVAVVLHVNYPNPSLVVITVMDVRRD